MTRARTLLFAAALLSLLLCVGTLNRWATDNPTARRWVGPGTQWPPGTPLPPGAKSVAETSNGPRSRVEIEFPLRDRRFVYFGAYRVPLTLAVVGTGALPALTIFMLANRTREWLMAHRRVGRNRCGLCGYDLRATPDRCPECGTVPTAQAPGPGGT